MKQEYPTYLKTIGKSKALAATLSDIEPEDDSNNKDDGILNAFSTTVNPTEGIVDRDGNLYSTRRYPIRPDPNGSNFTWPDKL